MHWYKRNIGDYHKKAGRLSILQHGVYMLLMDACYDREQFPTRDQAIEWVWASSQDEIAAVDLVLSKFFTEKDGVFYQSRIDDEVIAYQERSDKNKRIAQERERTRRESKRIEHESLTTGERVVHESPPNQEPRTKNQELEDKDLSVPAVAATTPYKQILSVYKEQLVTKGMTDCVKLSEARKSKIRSFWKKAEMTIPKWTAYCDYIAKNCTWMHTDRDNGKGGLWSKKDLFYIAKEETYLKIKEDAANDR